MNEWAKKTLNLATEGDYLDKLLEIYPAMLSPERPLPENIKKEINDLYYNRKYKDLVFLLINLKNMNYPFPIEHPYAALLRHLSKTDRQKVIERNPRVIGELANLVASLDLDAIIGGVERSKDINRTLGATFKSWIKDKFTTYPFRIVDDYNKLPRCENKDICIYAGPDEEIAKFIRDYLNLQEPAEGFFDRDLIIKVKGMYIIGEARFMSTPGGSQTRDLDNTLRFIEIMETITSNNIKAIALLDGIMWFHKPYIKKIKQSAIGDRVVMSALFLKDYLLSFFNSSP